MKIFTRLFGSNANDPFEGINLGDKARDTLTGFTGIVTARGDYLTGCAQVHLLPESPDANDLKDGHWFDIERVEVVQTSAVEIARRPTGSDIAPPRTTGRRV